MMRPKQQNLLQYICRTLPRKGCNVVESYGHQMKKAFSDADYYFYLEG